MNNSFNTLDLPLEGVTVLDFSQFLAGPACALRLADLGASVLKVERPQGGDLCRQLAVANQWVEEDSLLFHTINRNKGSITADLKDPNDLESIQALLRHADVMIHNFRPGVMERLGLGYEAVSQLNPKIIYGVVSGYGTTGPWVKKPGQDLLAQARSGMAWLSGNADQGPVPMGVSITDISAGMHLAQGILAALFRQARKNKGALVEVSLLASAMDIQFEQFTSYLNSSGDTAGQQPKRSSINNANIHATAPYGLYETQDGYLALAMTPIAQLHELLSIEGLASFSDPQDAFAKRDEIKTLLQEHLRTQITEHWLSLLEPAGVWCAQVLEWPDLEASGALETLEVIQTIQTETQTPIKTTTCPIRLDGAVLTHAKGAPKLGSNGALLKVRKDVVNNTGDLK